MKAMLWIGLALLILGFTLLFVPIPHKERSSLQIGPVGIKTEKQENEKVPPIASAAMILAGAGLMIGAGRK